MSGRVLITGGAGFVGVHVADELLRHGHPVRVLDNLMPEAHPSGRRPVGLHGDVELVVGDVRDADVVRRALAGVDAVIHLAAACGVGRSMYRLSEYASLNGLGTAVLLEGVLERRDRVRRLVVASSSAAYGEGAYKDPAGDVSPALERSIDQLRRHEWDVRNNRGEVLTPIPTPESKPLCPHSVYALGKHDQERLSLLVGRTYSVPTTVLRLFNVYGAGPAPTPSHPTPTHSTPAHPTVLPLFAAQILRGQAPQLFEDGRQSRDFVSALDVAHAFRLALSAPDAPYRTLNVGSGQGLTLAHVAGLLAAALGRPDLAPDVTHQYRVGDVRHCVADLRNARRFLGWAPLRRLDTDIDALAKSFAAAFSPDVSDTLHPDALAAAVSAPDPLTLLTADEPVDLPFDLSLDLPFDVTTSLPAAGDSLLRSVPDRTLSQPL